MQHVQQVLEIHVEFVRIAEADHYHAFVGGGNIARNERVGCVHQGNALEVDIGARELWRNVVNIVIHAAQDGIHHLGSGISAFGIVAMDFLYPFQVDHRHDAHQQVNVFGNVHVTIGKTAVQTFIEQQVGAFGDVFPGSKGAGFLTVGLAFFRAVNIFAYLSLSGFTKSPEQFLEFFKNVGFRAEVTEMRTFFQRLGHQFFHFATFIAVETVAFDDDRVLDALACENVLEGGFYPGCTGAGRAGNGDNRMLFGHAVLPICSDKRLQFEHETKRQARGLRVVAHCPLKPNRKFVP